MKPNEVETLLTQAQSFLPPATIDANAAVFQPVLDERVTDPARFRIAFVILLDGDLVTSPEHLGVGYMMAVLRRAGFNTKVFESRLAESTTILDIIQFYEPHFVCFTLMSLNVDSCLDLSASLKERLPKTVVACGGPAGTYSKLEILKSNPHLDIVAIGEGEPTIFDLAQCLYLGLDLKDCLGICYRSHDGSLHENSTRPLIHNLDDLPFPARDQFKASPRSMQYLRVSTSRGCVARCSFCSAPNLGNRVQKGRAWRGRSPKSVVSELSHLVETCGFRTFDFIDSTFEDPDGGKIGKARIAQIAQGILDQRLDIYYNCCMRAENWSDSDDSLLDLLMRSGLEKVNVGIESGVESELRLWGKFATVEDNIRIIRILREKGIYLAMGFIPFHPYSTIETISANANFLRDHAGHNLRRLTERLELYPGTAILDSVQQDGLLVENYWRTLDPYGYRFKDEAVGNLAIFFASLYNDADYCRSGVIRRESSVFQFETFNVVVQTFIIRITRKFGDIPGVADILEGFKQRVQSIRQRMADRNYAFFMTCLELVTSGCMNEQLRDSEVLQIENLFADTIREIRDLQLLAGRKLMRLGVDIAQIRSSIHQDLTQVDRTYTGSGTPCW